MTWCIDAPHLPHLWCGRVWRVWRIRPFHVPHHHPLLYSVVWCGVWQWVRLGVVNIGNEGGVVTWQRR